MKFAFDRLYVKRSVFNKGVPSNAMARALEVPMCRLFTDDAHVRKPEISFSRGETARNKKIDALLRPFAKVLARVIDKDRGLLPQMASKMANRS